MNVTRIVDYINRDMVVSAQDVLSRIQRGQVKAYAFLIKTDARRHRMGITGEYWDDPAQLLIGATRLQFKVNQLLSARDQDPETSTMPL